MLDEIDDEFKLDDQNRALPVDYGDVCINYDKTYFADNNLALPASLEDLLKPEYRGLLVVENPATSSPGLAFLMATVAQFGADGYLDFWQRLRDNEVVVVNDWGDRLLFQFQRLVRARPAADGGVVRLQPGGGSGFRLHAAG